MYCGNCGKKNTEKGTFCVSCGKEFPKSPNDKSVEEPLLTVVVASNKIVSFYNKYLVYNGISVPYHEFSDISYLLTRTSHSMYLIPTSKTSSFEIELRYSEKYILIQSEANVMTFFNDEALKNIDLNFSTIVGALQKVIFPVIVSKKLNEYTKNKSLSIDNTLTITPNGLVKSAFLRWKQPEVMPWVDYYNSQLREGNLYIYRHDVKNKYSVFYSCSMARMNSVIMPELLSILQAGNGSMTEQDRRTIENFIEESSDVIADLDRNMRCRLCMGPLNENSRYCIYCGCTISKK